MGYIGTSQPILNGIGGFVVTPSDTDNLVDDAGNTLSYEDEGYALSVGGAGDIKVTTIDGSVIIFSGRTAGSELPIIVKRVWSTGTTATLIVAIKGL